MVDFVRIFYSITLRELFRYYIIKLKMGTLISDAKAKAEQNAEKTSQFLDHSVKLMRLKHQEFIQSVLLSGSQQKQIPVSRFFQKRYEVRVSMKEGSQIAQQVTNIIGQFTDKKYTNAIGSILQVATDALIGSSVGSASQKRGYLISVGATGSVMRIDYLIYLKSVTSKTLITVAQNFYLCSYAISSVNIDGLKLPDLITAVSIAYKDSTPEQQLDLLKVLEEKVFKKTQ